MTIDQRLDRLTERHEALTQHVEILTTHLLESEKLFREGLLENQRLTQQLIGAMGETAEQIHTLLEVAASHQKRLSRLEEHNGISDT